jgi:hypothetical protein
MYAHRIRMLCACVFVSFQLTNQFIDFHKISYDLCDTEGKPHVVYY